MTIKKLERALLNSYSQELCYEKVRNHWTEENKTLGMCAITALVVNDYFKGDIAKIKVEGISHYFNIIDNKIIDLTKNQFKSTIDYKDYKIINRNDLLTEDTKNRYQSLKEKVIKELLQRIDQEIYQCTLCKNLVEKFPNLSTVYLGKNNDIVLIGEAPANNGWRKSHMLWKDINGKILPSGVILQKLFDIINKDIFETTFLESVKCFPNYGKTIRNITTKTNHNTRRISYKKSLRFQI